MDGFIALVKDIVHANGLEHADIHLERRVLTLPGYFRPTKLWDLLVMNEGRLILLCHISPPLRRQDSVAACRRRCRS